MAIVLNWIKWLWWQWIRTTDKKQRLVLPDPDDEVGDDGNFGDDVFDGGSDDAWQEIETCPADTSVFRDLDVRFVRSAISYLLEGPPIYMFVSVLPPPDLRLIFTSSYTIIFFNQM